MSLVQNPREHLLLGAENKEESSQCQGWEGTGMYHAEAGKGDGYK